MSSSGEKNWEQYADKLGALDWRRDAEIWQGNLLYGNRFHNQTGPVKAAFEKVSEAIGWDTKKVN
jgi:hypothetical protein